jgi:hypothetical protein
MFSNGSKRKTPKADIEYHFEHGEVINYTLDGVSIHSVAARYRRLSLLSCQRGRKQLRDFTMRSMVTLKQSLMAVIEESLGCISNIIVTPQHQPN